MQIGETILELGADGVYMTRIIVVVNRVSFLLPNDTSVQHISFFGQADLDQFAFRKFDQLGIV